ncbi:protein kinase domain-containing protein [Noviherbaspirillum soli]|uniref:protein kinase domain-containing protein n=1 Tax=Noviherbaspirillum soli TaxID=1064518 RepID=UPI00188D4341|nr:protein kinase [Noviherbaspirillum soli]
MESNEYGNTAAGPAPRDSGSFRSRLERAGSRVLAGGTRLGEFEIVGLIDESEVGITYLAYDQATRRDVTVWEYMPASLAARGRSGHVTPKRDADGQPFAAGLAAFLSEARVLCRFDSPFLVRIVRFWEANGTGYMVMPFYQGMLLQEAVESGRIQPNEDWIKSLLAQLFEPLEMMHAAHCYHPGIAPGNILLLADGRPLLLDFGAAQRVLGAGGHGPAADMRSGFAAIEEYDDIPNLKQGPWTDVYALAAVAYFLVAGRLPPPAPSRVANDAMTAAQQAGAGRYSAGFLAALDQALAVRPEHRFQSISAFRQALGIKPGARQGMPPARPGPDRHEPSGMGHAGGDTTPMRQPGAHAGIHAPDGRMTRQPARSRRTTWVAVLAGLLVLAAAGLWTLRQPEQAVVRTGPPPPAAATASAGKPEEPPAVAAAPAPEQVPAPASAAPAPAAPAAPAPAAPAAPTGATREEAQWLLASSLNNAAAYESYLRDYPDGRFAPIARAALERIRAVAEETPPAPSPAVTAASEEETLWKAVRNIDMPLVYESFLGKYPNGRHAADARARLARLRPAPAEPRPLPGQARQEPAGRPFAGSTDSRAPGLSAGASAAPSPPSPARPATEGNAPSPQPPAPAQPSQAPSDRVALAPPAAPAAAPRGEPANAAAQEAESEREPAPEPPLPRTRTLRLPNQIMTGDFTPDPVTGLVSGRGRIIWDNGDQFDGTMVRGQKEGRGEFRWANGQRYSGDWSRDQPNGRGTIQYPNGDRYTGDMRAGLPNGSGTLTFANGNRYRGEVRDGLPNGTGVNRFANGDVYSGAWSRGKAQGQGRYTWASGDYWEGEFSNDAKTDNGRLVSAARPQGNGNAPPRRAE